MTDISKWFGNAFSSPVEKNLTEEEREKENKLFEKISKAIVSRDLTIPAILFLEMHSPLGYMASQLAHGLGPFTSLVIKPEDMSVFAEAIGRRDGMDKLIKMIEAEDKILNQKEKVISNSQQKAEREV
jgi:hypothetical protein